MESILFQMFLNHPIEMILIIIQGVLVALLSIVIEILQLGANIISIMIDNWFLTFTAIWAAVNLRKEFKALKEENFWEKTKKDFSQELKNFNFKKDIRDGYKELKKEFAKEDLAKKRAKEKRKRI